MNIRNTLRILYLSIAGILGVYTYGLFFTRGTMTIFALQITAVIAIAGLSVTMVYLAYNIGRWLTKPPNL